MFYSNFLAGISLMEFVPGEYEVGVHIADVTYFLPPDTCLDTVAGSRATSVYLVQKVGCILCQLATMVSVNASSCHKLP